MDNKIIRLTKAIIPPVVFDIYRAIAGKTQFTGNYRTWGDARNASGGYNSDVILNKVRDSLLKVKNAVAVYERDSVLFNEVQYSWPLLAGLLWVASQQGNRLNLLDFGGSLGSTYFQNIKFLDHLEELRWSIVEQEKFVECGRQHFENDCLKFYYDLDECIRERHPDTILFSSVVQYLEKPYELLAEVLNRRFTYIIFDRTSFLVKGDDRITVQKVQPEIYPASYPAWFFNKDKFLNFFKDKYKMIADFESNDKANIISDFKGYIFKLKQQK